MLDMPPKDKFMGKQMPNYDEMLRRLLKKQKGSRWGLSYGNYIRKARSMARKFGGDSVRLAYNLAMNTGVKSINAMNLDFNQIKKLGWSNEKVETLYRLSYLYAGYEKVRPIIIQYINDEIYLEELNRLLKQFRNTPEYVQGSD